MLKWVQIPLHGVASAAAPVSCAHTRGNGDVAAAADVHAQWRGAGGAVAGCSLAHGMFQIQ